MVEEILNPLLEQNWQYGFAPLKKPLSIAHYRAWLDNGFHGDMEYLKRHLEFKESPKKLLKKAQSAIVLTKPYFPIPDPIPDNALSFKKLKIALYARQKDYHLEFQEELDSLVQKLKSEYPEEDFLAFTDSKPVLERDLAYQAGLGWVGKNTCLIHEKKGSLFFIGEIYTTLKLQTKIDLHPDRCGTCTQCIDICPTGALVEPRVLDANKCISYWTIEAKKSAPIDIRKKMGPWYFGCDMCQTICPWNQKLFKQEMVQELSSYTEKDKVDLESDLRKILRASNSEIQEFFKDTPLLRAKPWAHKRNAIIVLVNCNLSNLKDDIAKLKDDEKLSDLVSWAMQELS